MVHPYHSLVGGLLARYPTHYACCLYFAVCLELTPVQLKTDFCLFPFQFFRARLDRLHVPSILMLWIAFITGLGQDSILAFSSNPSL